MQHAIIPKKQNELSIKDLDVAGCDGSNTNTGWKNSVIRQIKVCVGRPLQEASFCSVSPSCFLPSTSARI